MTRRPPIRLTSAPTITAFLAALAVVALPARAAVAVGARTLCVGGPGCFPTIQLAVDAARDGDSVKIGPGTFAGGVTIAKSITVVGAGASRTIVKGGGPVFTIGDLLNVKRVEVIVRGLTITGGLNRGNVNWTENGPGNLQAPWGPGGGGVLVDGADVTKAETVATIVDCVITRNSVQPARRKGGSDHNAFLAGAHGGGIVNIGQLTLIRTTVSDNVAGGGPTTDASGGGIWNATSSGPGSLTIRDSRITGNTAIVTSNHPDKAEGGGIEAQDGLTFTITGSVVSGNRAILDTHEPPGSPFQAAAGGIEIGGFGKATIASTRITGNLARVIDPQGDANVGASGLFVGGPKEQLVIRDTTITGNRTEATILSEKAGPPNCCPDGAVEIASAGTVTRTTIARNTIVVRVKRGTAVLIGTVSSQNADPKPLVITDSVIERNTSRVTNTGGAAWAVGGGVANFGLMVLRHTRISDNTLTAIGKSGFARGGGVLNGPGFSTKGRLTLTGGTVVTRNVLRGSSGIALEGGGLYAGLPVKVQKASIAGNTPDQCHGC